MTGETILLVGHGSRDASSNREIEEFAQQWRRRHIEWNIELCFIEFDEILLDAGLERAALGARRVIVVPLILNAAGHVKMEIPQHIGRARAVHPETEFIYAPNLGACDPILSILKRRLNQAMDELDMPDPGCTGVIILGRGSSDCIANGEMAKMARWLQEQCEHDLVDITFTGITHPRLERGVQRHIRLGMTQIVVLPYYLFTGILMERIKRQMEHLKRQYPHIRFARGEYFGFEQEIFEILDQRVQDAMHNTGAMPCDGCNYRKLAEQQQAHNHHHHHHANIGETQTI